MRTKNVRNLCDQNFSIDEIYMQILGCVRNRTQVTNTLVYSEYKKLEKHQKNFEYTMSTLFDFRIKKTILGQFQNYLRNFCVVIKKCWSYNFYKWELYEW